MHNRIEVNVALPFKIFFSSSETVCWLFCFFLTYKTHINFLTGKNKAVLKRATQIGSWKAMYRDAKSIVNLVMYLE